MEWTDEAIILSVRPHGETAAIVELLTRRHGRHLGLVHGGRSRKQRPVLQIGNHVDATWKARLTYSGMRSIWSISAAHFASPPNIAR